MLTLLVVLNVIALTALAALMQFVWTRDRQIEQARRRLIDGVQAAANDLDARHARLTSLAQTLEGLAEAQAAAVRTYDARVQQLREEAVQGVITAGAAVAEAASAISLELLQRSRRIESLSAEMETMMQAKAAEIEQLGQQHTLALARVEQMREQLLADLARAEALLAQGRAAGWVAGGEAPL